jgi:hypothetical protein
MIRTATTVLLSAVLLTPVHAEPVQDVDVAMDMPAAESAAMKRYREAWGSNNPYDNEFYASFKYSPAHGLGYEPGVSRRDPSRVIRVDGTYYVYYTRSLSSVEPVGYKKADDTTPAVTWDYSAIYFATSEDGHHWEEQGKAVGPGPRGEFDDRSVFTPDVLEWQGKYYLYYQAVKAPYRVRTRNVIGMSWAERPGGPWHRWPQPVLEPGEAGEWLGEADDRSAISKPGAFDSLKVHDPTLLVRDGKLWLYYKAHPMGLRGETRLPYPDFSTGVAIAEAPEGPFVKSALNPVLNSGHEVVVWPWKSGVAALVTANGPEKNTVQYAEDGLNFEVQSIVVMPPDAAGLYVPDAHSNTEDGQGFTWGLSHVAQRPKDGRPWPHLIRFDTDFTGRTGIGKHNDRARFKSENIRFSEEALLRSRQ